MEENLERELTQKRLMEPCGFCSGDKKSEEGSNHHIPLETCRRCLVKSRHKQGRFQLEMRKTLHKESACALGQGPEKWWWDLHPGGVLEVDWTWPGSAASPAWRRKLEQRTLEVLPTCLL